MPFAGVFAIIRHDSETGLYYAESVRIQGCKPPAGQAEDIKKQVETLNAPPQPRRDINELVAAAFLEAI